MARYSELVEIRVPRTWARGRSGGSRLANRTPVSPIPFVSLSPPEPEEAFEPIGARSRATGLIGFVDRLSRGCTRNRCLRFRFVDGRNLSARLVNNQDRC